MTQQIDTSTSPARLEPGRVQTVFADMRLQQNLALGTAMGGLAALIGAGIWALTTVLTGYQIGWMAVGVGVLVGFVVRHFGKGVDRTFGLVGAALAFLGCVLGNLFAVCGLVSIEEGVSFFQIVGRLDAGIARQLMVATFNPIDLLFYGLAIYEGYKFSFRQITEEDLPELRTSSTA